MAWDDHHLLISKFTSKFEKLNFKKCQICSSAFWISHTCAHTLKIWQQQYYWLMYLRQNLLGSSERVKPPSQLIRKRIVFLNEIWLSCLALYRGQYLYNYCATSVKLCSGLNTFSPRWSNDGLFAVPLPPLYTHWLHFMERTQVIWFCHYKIVSETPGGCLCVPKSYVIYNFCLYLVYT